MFFKKLIQVDWSCANNFELENDTKEYTKHISDYLKNFGEKFEKSVRMLLCKNLKADELKCDYEILHHAKLCNHSVQNFTNRPELMNTVTIKTN